jgi:hypothetical protein
MVSIAVAYGVAHRPRTDSAVRMRCAIRHEDNGIRHRHPILHPSAELRSCPPERDATGLLKSNDFREMRTKKRPRRWTH